MFYLYDATTNTQNLNIFARNWVALRSYILTNNLKNHYITHGPLQRDHSNIIKAYRPTH